MFGISEQLPQLVKYYNLADGQEGIYIADFPIEEMREYRSREVHGNAYRHPEKYKLLISEKIEEPFIRKDYRK